MTHDELLAEINWIRNLETQDGDNLASINASIPAALNALRAVVELHKPEAQEHGEYEKCWNCSLLYPCPTIQAIEKELK